MAAGTERSLVGEAPAKNRLQTERMQRLYDAGQSDVLKLLQVQRRFIDARNVQLDTIWQSTQAYADLLTATGGTPLLGAPPSAAR